MGRGRATRRLFTGVLAALVLALVAFHGWLFWLRAAEGRLLDPVVALRWTAGAALVITLLALRSRGVPIFRGHKALVVWLLVGLLHWSAGSPADQPDERPFRVAELLFVLPGAAAPAALTLAFFGAAGRAPDCQPLEPTGLVHVPAASPFTTAGLLLLSPRAPPA